MSARLTFDSRRPVEIAGVPGRWWLTALAYKGDPADPKHLTIDYVRADRGEEQELKAEIITILGEMLPAPQSGADR